MKGGFALGAALEIVGPDDQVVARGLAAMSSDDLIGLMGQRGPREAVHRDDLVILVNR